MLCFDAVMLCSKVIDSICEPLTEQELIRLAAPPLITAPWRYGSASLGVGFYIPSYEDPRELIPYMQRAGTTIAHMLASAEEHRLPDLEAFSLPEGLDFMVQQCARGKVVRLIQALVKAPETKDECDKIGLPFTWTRVAPSYYMVDTDEVLHNTRVAESIRIDIRVQANRAGL